MHCAKRHTKKAKKKKLEQNNRKSKIAFDSLEVERK